MRVVLRSSSLWLTVAGILANAGIVRSDTALRRGVAGKVRLGMRPDEIEAEYPSLTVAKDSEVDVYFHSSRERTPDLAAKIADSAVVRIEVHSPRFRTACNVGVGSTLRDLTSHYPVEQIGPYAYAVKDLGMTFEIDGERIESVVVG